MPTNVPAGSSAEYYASLTAGAATSLTLSGLNGDQDGDYFIDIEAASAANTNNLKIQINGSDTNLDSLSANTLVGGVARTDWSVAQAAQSPATFSANDLFRFQGRLIARSGRIRIMTGLAYTIKGGATTGFQEYCRYNDTTTNVTSMAIVASQSNGLGTTTFIRCVRIQTLNPLA